MIPENATGNFYLLNDGEGGDIGMFITLVPKVSYLLAQQLLGL